MPILGYWKIRALGQPIRLLLNYVEQDFEDLQYEQGEAPDYSRDSWYKVKYTLGLPFPNLPYYIDGDIKITQSDAIIRYIARKHDLLGKTEREKVNVDILLAEAMDTRIRLWDVAYSKQYEDLKGDYFKKLPGTLDQYEQFLGDKDWFAANKITVPDFVIYEILDTWSLMQPGCIDNHKKLVAFMKRFEAIPNIKKYMASDKFMRRPCHSKNATFK